MSDPPTAVAVLTPAGAGAIATVAVAGPRAWPLARDLFRTLGGKELPAAPELHRFWVGRIAGGDEVVLAVRAVSPEVRVELHGHGGRRVVRWVVEQFTARGCVEADARGESAWDLLARAPTLRTANVLLDQAHGAFERAVRASFTDRAALRELARYAEVGRHLVEPWRVVVAGPPNVGKSSLVNALAGYQRAVVSPVPGTTRDVVTVPVAFDGWPVELADTAGLRDATGLEAAGIERAKQQLAHADLVLWVLDASADELELPDEETESVFRNNVFIVLNKSDIMLQPRNDSFPGMIPVSALTGQGIPGLVAAVAKSLVYYVPPPGAGVPYTSALADRVYQARVAREFGDDDEADALLRACLGPG